VKAKKTLDFIKNNDSAIKELNFDKKGYSDSLPNNNGFYSV